MKPRFLDPATVPVKIGSPYPEPFRSQVSARRKQALGDALGPTNYGVNPVEPPPGALSTMRHWHSKQDEFIYVPDGGLTLITDRGEQILRAGMAAGFPAASGDGCQLINRSDTPARYLEVGDRHLGDAVVYSDVDLDLPDTAKPVFFHKDGTPYS